MNTDRKQYAHLYNTTAWKTCSKAFIAAHPLCRYCEDLGYLVAAEVVDHKIPHRGDRELFFDQNNWQSLCKRCHDHVKQTEERSGRRPGTRLDGTPVDPKHAWNR